MQRLQSRVFAGLLQEGISPGSACQAARTLVSLLAPLQATSGTGQPGPVSVSQTAQAAPSTSRHSQLPHMLQRGFAAEPAQAEQPETLEDLELVRARIFGNHIGDGRRSGRKVLRRPLKGDKVANWYLDAPMAKLDPLFVDPDIEMKREKAEKLWRRGKGPPKKGQGKRAVKRKRK